MTGFTNRYAKCTLNQKGIDQLRKFITGIPEMEGNCPPLEEFVWDVERSMILGNYPFVSVHVGDVIGPDGSVFTKSYTVRITDDGLDFPRSSGGIDNHEPPQSKPPEWASGQSQDGSPSPDDRSVPNPADLG